MSKNQTKLFLRSVYTALLTLPFFLLTACGGGGGSTSGTGGGVNLSAASSTLVIDASNINGVAIIDEPQPFDPENNTLIANLLHLVLPDALANHIQILLNGVNFGRTSDEETFMIAVTAGNYEVTFIADGENGGRCSTDIVVGNDQIIFLTDIAISESSTCEYVRTDDNIEDDLISGGDSAPSGKTLVCHKNNKAISVSPNSVSAHLAHGDITGPCEVDIATTDETSSEDGISDDDDVSNDNVSEENTEKPEKPEKPGKPNNPGNPNSTT